MQFDYLSDIGLFVHGYRPRLINMMIVFFTYFSGVLGAVDCETKDILGCSEIEECEWIFWNPPVCQNICSYYETEAECSKTLNCAWNQGCYYLKCNEFTNKDLCNKIVSGFRSVEQVACEWNGNQCWDQSCIKMQADSEGNCPGAYCLWNEARQLCYDKFCGDYENQIVCEQLSFCYWDKYRCLRNSTVPQIKY